jgi:hypothetical protein
MGSHVEEDDLGGIESAVVVVGHYGFLAIPAHNRISKTETQRKEYII